MDKDTSTSWRVLAQDLGILLFFVCVGSGALITALGERTVLRQNVILLMVLLLISLLVMLRAQVAGAIVTALSLLSFTVYKLYTHVVSSVPIEWTAYLWPALMLGVLGGLTLFIAMFSTLEGVNGILNRRLNELTVVDPLTGMENMRSMLTTLKRYMALCERNGTMMGLMMVRLRYADEIKKVLTQSQFNDLRYNLATTVHDVLRLEDRVFSIDDNGSLGVIYFSAEAGAGVVKSRILSAVANKDMLPSLVNQTLTVELSVVYKQYTKEMGRDALKLVDDVEKEFAYEV